MSLPQDPKVREKIKKQLDEISNAMTRIEAERDYIRESIKETCDEHQLSKKTFRRMAKTHHKRNFPIEVADHEEFEEMYQELTGITTLGEV